MPEQAIKELINVISLSRFLFHLICRHPEMLGQFCSPTGKTSVNQTVSCIDDLRIYKYHELLRLTRIDMQNLPDYGQVLADLSYLAEFVFNKTVELSLSPSNREVFERYFCTYGLGKLGASELNYSSDIDLVFLCANPADVPMAVHEYQQILQDGIRLTSSQLEHRTIDGFLYRVDLKLRPWGSSGPLVMSIDETENYYAASTETWERFAWLRARIISGNRTLGNDLLSRLQPFIYKRSLSSDDLDRFVEIKNEMYRVRRKKGHWNVKLGEGGIRDIEFFVQMLQMVNAATHPALKVTGTMNVLAELRKYGLIPEPEEQDVHECYMFLRKLENHLQMIDEHQTHELPDDPRLKTIIARSLNISGQSDAEILDTFETRLFNCRTIARGFFERILPQQHT